MSYGTNESDLGSAAYLGYKPKAYFFPKGVRKYLGPDALLSSRISSGSYDLEHNTDVPSSYVRTTLGGKRKVKAIHAPTRERMSEGPFDYFTGCPRSSGNLLFF